MYKPQHGLTQLITSKTMKKINLFERLFLLNNLPKTGKYETLVTIKELEKKLSLNEKEEKLFGIVQDDSGMVKWNEKGNKVKFDFDFKELELLVIKGSLRKLNDSEKLPIQVMELYKAFCL